MHELALARSLLAAVQWNLTRRARIIVTSALSGEGINEWLAAFDQSRRALFVAPEERA
jgi:hypothetical protein